MWYKPTIRHAYLLNILSEGEETFSRLTIIAFGTVEVTVFAHWHRKSLVGLDESCRNIRTNHSGTS